jgi:hypothetical protein
MLQDISFLLPSEIFWHQIKWITNGGQLRIWNELTMVYPRIYHDRLNKLKNSVKVINNPPEIQT